MGYDYEKENNKVCPVCGHVIDYHVDGFMHDKVLNVWICRDHKGEEINKSIVLKDPELMRDLMHLRLTEAQAIKLGWKPYPQLGTYLRMAVWKEEEYIQCCPMNTDGTMDEEQAGDVDSWNELYIELYESNDDPKKQQLIDDIKKPYIPMVYGKTEEAFRSILQEAEQAIFLKVLESYPQIKTGDFPPDATIELSQAVEKAVRYWLAINYPKSQ